MQSAATVAAIIPTYNRADRLPAALGSVLAQTRAVDEVLVIDDGSDDATRAALDPFAGRVRYEYQQHRGVSAARNRGIRISSCEWLAFLDSDDRWCARKIERQLAALDDDTRIAHTDEIWIRNGRRVNPMRKHAKAGGHIYRNCLPRCVISPSSVIIHRSLLDDIGLFDETMPACEDYDLWLRACAVERVGYLAERLVVKYGGHDDQLSRQVWGLDRFRIRALEKILESDSLSPGDRLATLSALSEKLSIYAQGAFRRGRHEEAERYASKRRHWQLALQALDGRGLQS